MLDEIGHRLGPYRFCMSEVESWVDLLRCTNAEKQSELGGALLQLLEEQVQIILQN